MNSKISNFSSLLSSLTIDLKEEDKLKSELIKLLKLDLVYFNIVRLDFSIEKNFIQIPMRVQKTLEEFENNVRTFLKNQLLKNVKGEIKTYFPNKTFKDLRKGAIKEMKRSGKSISEVDVFKQSNYKNHDDLTWIFQEMSFGDYSAFIKHNNSFLNIFFTNIDYEEDIRLLGKMRNIPAHNKERAERDISKHLEILYEYEKIFKFLQ